MYICTKQGSFTIQDECPAVSNFRRSRWKILVWWVDGWMDTVVSFPARNGAEQSHHPLRESIQSAKCPKLLIALALRTRAILTCSRAGYCSPRPSSLSCALHQRGGCTPRLDGDCLEGGKRHCIYRTVRVRSTTVPSKCAAAVYRVGWPWLLCLRTSSMAALDWLAMAGGSVRIEGIAKFGK